MLRVTLGVTLGATLRATLGHRTGRTGLELTLTWCSVFFDKIFFGQIKGWVAVLAMLSSLLNPESDRYYVDNR